VSVTILDLISAASLFFKGTYRAMQHATSNVRLSFSLKLFCRGP